MSDCDVERMESIMSQPNQQEWRWIKSENQLPPTGTDVLTVTYGKTLVIGHLMKDGEWSHTCMVTHWQRLPRIPTTSD